MSSTDKDNVKTLINRAKMTCQKKLLVLNLEDLHFKPLVDSLLGHFFRIRVARISFT